MKKKLVRLTPLLFAAGLLCISADTHSSPELKKNKNVANGYAPLDGSSKVPIGNVPTGTTSTTVPLGNDARFSDTRTPTDNTVSTAKLQDDSVTYGKMQNISATARVLGRKTSGSGDTEELTLSEVLDLIGSAAQGDVLYRGVSTWTRLAAGTAGQVLTSGGSGANVSWTTPSGGTSEISKTYIGGLLVTKSSNTAIAISAGKCWDPSSSQIITYAGGTLSPTLGASQHFSVYLYDASGTATVEAFQEDPPSATYAGVARKRATGHGGRYIGSIWTDGSSHLRAIRAVELAGGAVLVMHGEVTNAAPYRILAAGTATGSYTSVSSNLAAILPRYVAPEILATLYWTLTGTAGAGSISISTDGTGESGNLGGIISTTGRFISSANWTSCDPTGPSLYYINYIDAGTTPNAYIDLIGYRLLR